MLQHLQALMGPSACPHPCPRLSNLARVCLVYWDPTYESL